MRGENNLKRVEVFLSFIFVVVFCVGVVDATRIVTGCDSYIDSCQNLTDEDHTYCLSKSITDFGEQDGDYCMDIQDNDITLDCNGKSIDFSQSGYGESGKGGVYAYNVYDIIVEDCKKIHTDKETIYFYDVYDFQIYKNEQLTSKDENAIKIKEGAGDLPFPITAAKFEIEGNTIKSSGKSGIYLENTEKIEIMNNVIQNNAGDGINIFHSDSSDFLGVKIWGNTIDENTGNGIFAQFPETIDAIRLSHYKYDLEINYNKIRKNKKNGIEIKNGVQLKEKRHVGILLNRIAENEKDGIFLDSAPKSDIFGNVVIGQYRYGMYFKDSADLDIVLAMVRNNGVNENVEQILFTHTSKPHDAIPIYSPHDDGLTKWLLTGGTEGPIYILDPVVIENPSILPRWGFRLVKSSINGGDSEEPGFRAVGYNGVDNYRLLGSVSENVFVDLDTGVKLEKILTGVLKDNDFLSVREPWNFANVRGWNSYTTLQLAIDAEQRRLSEQAFMLDRRIQQMIDAGLVPDSEERDDGIDEEWFNLIVDADEIGGDETDAIVQIEESADFGASLLLPDVVGFGVVGRDVHEGQFNLVQTGDVSSGCGLGYFEESSVLNIFSSSTPTGQDPSCSEILDRLGIPSTNALLKLTETDEVTVSFGYTPTGGRFIIGREQEGIGIEGDPLENNTIANLGFTGFEYGILLSEAENHVLLNLGFNNNTYAIFLNDSSNNFFHYLNMTNNTYGVYLNNSDNNSFFDSNLSGNNLWDVYLEKNSGDNSFINCSYNTSREYVGTGSKLSREWNYIAYVNDSYGTDGNEVQGVNITAYNSSDDIIFSELTGMDGWINFTSLVEYVNSEGIRNYYSNYTINVTKQGYYSINRTYNVSIEHDIEDVFTLDIQSSTIPPVVGLESPAYGAGFAQGERTFNCSATDEKGLENITLHIWNSTRDLVQQETKSLSGYSDSETFDYTFTYDDIYKWNCLAYDDSDYADWNPYHYDLFIDSIAPAIEIYTPEDKENVSSSILLIQYNFTEEYPDSCWWTNDSGVTNYTIYCGDRVYYYNVTNMTNMTYEKIDLGYSMGYIIGQNYSINTTNVTEILNWSEGWNNITVYINDSVGGEASDSVDFYVETKENVSFCRPLFLSNTVYNLTNSIFTNYERCISILADNITLNCNGNSIVGNISMFGILIENADDFKLNDCLIENFTYGLYFDNSSHAEIRDSSLTFSYLSLGNLSINNSFYNVSYELEDETVMEGGELTRYWHYRAYVNDANIDADASDSKGDNDGVLNGGVIEQDSFYTGDDGYIQVLDDDSLDSMSEITVSAWIKTNNTGDAGRWIVKKYGIDNPWPGYGLRLVDDGGEYSVGWWAGGVGGSNWLYCNQDLRDDEWHHIIATAKTGGLNKIYVDGEFCSERATGEDGFSSSHNLTISSWNDSGGGIFKGYIGNLKIWNLSLTSDEISEEYKYGAWVRNQELVSHWTFENIVPNVNVSVVNKTGEYNFSLTTDSSGYTDVIEIIDYVNKGNWTRDFYSDYAINISKSGYTNTSVFYDVTEEQNNLKHVITFIPNDTNKFYIKNNLSEVVGWFGDKGNLVISGVNETDYTAPTGDSFIIKNSSDNTTAYTDSDGNFYYAGNLSEEQSSCDPSPDSAFIVKNSSGANVSYIKFGSGDVCLTGNLYKNVVF